MTDKRLFIAISTGQNVANVPPIVQMVQPGDSLLWLESTHAKLKGWATGAAEVLRARGLVSQHRRAIGDSLDQLHDALRGALPELSRGRHVVVVGNGGTKLQCMALWQAVCQQVDHACMVYGEGRPCAWSQTSDLLAGVTTHPYHGQGIRLDEVLECSGHAATTDYASTCFWPGESGSLPMLAYGADPAYTVGLHEKNQEWSAHKQEVDAERLPGAHMAMAALPESDETLQGFRRKLWAAMRGALLRPNKRSGEARTALDEKTYLLRCRDNPAALEAVYSIILDFARHVHHESKRGSAEKPRERVGDALELAVARRVHAWLEREPAVAKVVSEVHTGVQVVAKADPDKIVAEYDVLLVLRNGVLLNLECKAGDQKQKDHDARDNRLHQATSSLARSVLVVPLYTQHAQSEWFAHYRKLAAKYNGIGFTLPGQPTQAEWISEDGGMESLSVPAFEDALMRRLKGYLPG